MTEIEFRSVEKNFLEKPPLFSRLMRRVQSSGPFHALCNLSLLIPDGEFFTFVGPSGSGKSTALNIIAGLERPSSGQVLFNNRVVNDLEPRDRDVAMVFQSYALYPHLSVFENIAFPLRLRREKQAEIHSKVDRIAAALGLTALLFRRPRQLSGGQRQRVALARALVRRPGVFLMDEPLSNLDARLRLQMRSEIRRMHRAYGITTIYVTHDQEEAMVLSDRMALLRSGELQQCGSPLEIYRDPDNLFAAQFLGSPPINIIPGEHAAKLWGREVIAPHILPEEVVCGVRPSDMKAGTSEQSDAGALAINGRIAAVETTGDQTWVDIESTSANIRAAAHSGFKALEGGNAAATFPRSALLCFIKQSGRRAR